MKINHFVTIQEYNDYLKSSSDLEINSKFPCISVVDEIHDKYRNLFSDKTSFDKYFNDSETKRKYQYATVYLEQSKYKFKFEFGDALVEFDNNDDGISDEIIIVPCKYTDISITDESDINSINSTKVITKVSHISGDSTHVNIDDDDDKTTLPSLFWYLIYQGKNDDENTASVSYYKFNDIEQGKTREEINLNIKQMIG